MNPVIVLLLLAASAYAAQEGCECGWTQFQQSCYKHFIGPNMTQSAAEFACKKEGAGLASITSKAENAFLTELSSTGGRFYLSQQPWIGLVWEGECWSWTDESFSDGTEWADGEPKHALGSEKMCTVFVPDIALDESCDEVLFNGEKGVITDVACDGLSPRYICKKPLAPSSAPLRSPIQRVLPVAASCPTNSELGADGKCQCKKGNIDILDTSILEKEKYQRGMMCIPDKPCSLISKPMSIIFVIDSSGSIGTDWPNVVKFVEMAASQVPKTSRVGFIQFSHQVTHSAWIKEGWTEKDFIAGIPRKFIGSITNTPDALNKAIEMMQGDKNEMRLVIVITDGVPLIQVPAGQSPTEVAQKLTLEAAKKLQNSGVKLLVMGMGAQVASGAGTIRQWLKDPEHDYFAYHQAAAMFTSDHMKNVLTRACEAPSHDDFLKAIRTI